MYMYYNYKLYKKKKYKKNLSLLPFFVNQTRKEERRKKSRDKGMDELFCKEEENKKGHDFHNE